MLSGNGCVVARAEPYRTFENPSLFQLELLSYSLETWGNPLNASADQIWQRLRASPAQDPSRLVTPSGAVVARPTLLNAWVERPGPTPQSPPERFQIEEMDPRAARLHAPATDPPLPPPRVFVLRSARQKAVGWLVATPMLIDGKQFLFFSKSANPSAQVPLLAALDALEAVKTKLGLEHLIVEDSAHGNLRGQWRDGAAHENLPPPRGFAHAAQHIYRPVIQGPPPPARPSLEEWRLRHRSELRRMWPALSFDPPIESFAALEREMRARVDLSLLDNSRRQNVHDFEQATLKHFQQADMPIRGRFLKGSEDDSELSQLFARGYLRAPDILRQAQARSLRLWWLGQLSPAARAELMEELGGPEQPDKAGAVLLLEQEIQRDPDRAVRRLLGDSSWDAQAEWPQLLSEIFLSPHADSARALLARSLAQPAVRARLTKICDGPPDEKCLKRLRGSMPPPVQNFAFADGPLQMGVTYLPPLTAQAALHREPPLLNTPFEVREKLPSLPGDKFEAYVVSRPDDQWTRNLLFVAKPGTPPELVDQIFESHQQKKGQDEPYMPLESLGTRGLVTPLFDGPADLLPLQRGAMARLQHRFLERTNHVVHVTPLFKNRAFTETHEALAQEILGYVADLNPSLVKEVLRRNPAYSGTPQGTRAMRALLKQARGFRDRPPPDIAPRRLRLALTLGEVVASPEWSLQPDRAALAAEIDRALHAPEAAAYVQQRGLPVLFSSNQWQNLAGGPIPLLSRPEHATLRKFSPGRRFRLTWDSPGTKGFIYESLGPAFTPQDRRLKTHLIYDTDEHRPYRLLVAEPPASAEPAFRDQDQRLAQLRRAGVALGPPPRAAGPHARLQAVARGLKLDEWLARTHANAWPLVPATPQGQAFKRLAERLEQSGVLPDAFAPQEFTWNGQDWEYSGLFNWPMRAPTAPLAYRERLLTSIAQQVDWTIDNFKKAQSCAPYVRSLLGN